MKIKLDPRGLRQTKLRDYAVRFFFGGSVTVLAGLIAQKYGAGLGGLFLAFPAIFPASATLIEKREKQKKLRLGLHGIKRARSIAGVDACGATLGSAGLFVFAAILCLFLPAHPPSLILFLATLAWFAVSVLLWIVRKRLWPRARRR